MAYTVEDGNGLAAANSFQTIASLDAYHYDRGNEDWLGKTLEEKQPAAIDAARYLTIVYRWPGDRLNAVQGLAWPRVGAWRHTFTLTSSEIPVEVLEAQAILARHRLSAVLIKKTPDDGRIQSYSKVIHGAITKNITYAGSASQILAFPEVDLLLDPLILGSVGKKPHFFSR